MKQYTIKDIRNLKPCYDPTKYTDESWSGTVVDILKAKKVPARDRLWVATKFLPDSINREFAFACAVRAIDNLELQENKDFITLILFQFESGEFDPMARYAACYAALSAVRSAACYAALYAASSAADSAVRYAALSAVRSAACYAAARPAAHYAARPAAHYAELREQIKYLIELIEYKLDKE